MSPNFTPSPSSSQPHHEHVNNRSSTELSTSLTFENSPSNAASASRSSLELEVPARSASLCPLDDREKRPSGLVSIRFFPSAPVSALPQPLAPRPRPIAIASAPPVKAELGPPAPGTCSAKTRMELAAKIINRKEQSEAAKVTMNMMQRAGLYGVIKKQTAKPADAAEAKRGRGRPRTRSAEDASSHAPKAATPKPRPVLVSAPMPVLSELNLPRIAPRPPMPQQNLGMIQPNSMMQARALMARPTPGLVQAEHEMRRRQSTQHEALYKHPRLISPAKQPTSHSMSNPASPELDVLRLISDACEIHGRSQDELQRRSELSSSMELKITSSPHPGEMGHRRILPKGVSQSSNHALSTSTPDVKRRLLPKAPLPNLLPSSQQ